RCPQVRLVNGRVRSRARGRIIRFSCYEGFSLVGSKYATCFRGQWDRPTPICVKLPLTTLSFTLAATDAECPAPAVPEHALMAPKYNGAILLYFCEPGYTLIGSHEIYCDGRHWNGTVPYCRDTTASPPTQCDFEKPDLCWWEQDPLHDFDWQRHNFETANYHIGTGPSHDHTLGPGNDGYYLYIEATGRLENDSARIISPIYNASYTDSGCFSFWYHMFGAKIGALNVYFKQENDLLPRLMFNKEGNQGNQWLHGIFSLPKAKKGFQIIIEGVRGSDYVSDIAVDDVAILQGDKCRDDAKAENEGVTEGDDDQIELVNAQQTCRGKCKNSVTYNFTTSMPPTPTESCLCTLDCEEQSLCCPDYAEYCILAYTSEANATVEQSTIPSHEGAVSVAPTKKSTMSDMATVRSGFSINPKDDIDPVTLKPSTTVTTIAPTTTISTTTRRKTEKPTRSTKRATQSIVTTRAIQTSVTPFVRLTSTPGRYAPVNEKPGNANCVVSRSIVKLPGRPASSRVGERVALRAWAFEWDLRVGSEPEESRKLALTKGCVSAFHRDPAGGGWSRLSLDSNERRQDPEKISRGSRFSLSGIIAAVVGILTGVSISLMLLVIILRRRKTYKRGTNGSALSEDSDVRFLTSDEILDFTLARPSDNDET
ncbi:MAM domain-containing glycosylphosphatidylinositol anchor protein 1, partial [Melipona quadrifasciata]